MKKNKKEESKIASLKNSSVKKNKIDSTINHKKYL